MALTSSRADVDMGMVLVHNTAEEVRSASLYVVGRAIDEEWPTDEMVDVLQGLGLVEADLDPERHSQANVKRARRRARQQQ